MVGELVLGSNGPSSIPGREHGIVFLSKALYTYSACLHPGVQMGTSEFNTGGSPVMNWHPF